MNPAFDFRKLFIFDLANNHQGQLDHGRHIVRAVGEVARVAGVRAALKFQFRQLETFIHPAHQRGSTAKHIPRFLETKLSEEDYAALAQEVVSSQMVTMATPFDEESVGMLERLNIEVAKIASCSARDWPLLERVADSNRPVVVSTGGLSLSDIDNIVSFFDHKRVHFALMHCVSIYPIPDEHMQLRQIALLRRRYPGKVIGFSTHELPGDTQTVIAAVALGAELLERHVGIPTESIQLNKYSSTPEELAAWISAAGRAEKLCGVDGQRPRAAGEEEDSIQSLRRGVYARQPLKEGTALSTVDVYFAMPCEDGQLSSGEFRCGVVLSGDADVDDAIKTASLVRTQDVEKQNLFAAIHTIKAMLNEAHIPLSTDFEAEFSHHFGLAQFAEWGATIITCVNRSYCKKLVIQTPGQKHPSHYHKRKEETFQVLYGELEVEVEGRRRKLLPGDTLLVQQGVWHEFSSQTGVIFEEISTQHYNDDSFYEDKRLNSIPRSARKTVVNNWGRYQI
ncbi:MAG: N-acetylneuraminate synthase family protein [Gemmatimonadota bacterium]